MEGNEVPIGWPFGLGNMSPTITVGDASQSAAAAAPPQRNAPRILRSSSLSSFSSSNLDTESTGSFFPDQSVTLGRLIGMKPMNKGRFLHHLRHHHHHRLSGEMSHLGVPKFHENCQGICAPLLYHVIEKMGISGSNKRP